MFKTLISTILTFVAAVQLADSKRLDANGTPLNEEVLLERFLQSEEQIQLLSSSCTFRKEECPSDAKFGALSNE